MTILNLLKENDLRSIAFPCISTGIYGYPQVFMIMMMIMIMMMLVMAMTPGKFCTKAISVISRTLLAVLLSALSGHFWKSTETVWIGWAIWKHTNSWIWWWLICFFDLFIHWQDPSHAGDLLPLPERGRDSVQGKDASHVPKSKIWARRWGGGRGWHKLNWGESERGRRFGQIVIPYKLNQQVFWLCWLSENGSA